MPDSIDTPTYRTLLIVGRPEGGAFDPETGETAPGGVCWRDGAVERRAEPGEVVDVPVKPAAGFVNEGLAIDPPPAAEAPPATEPVVTDVPLVADAPAPKDA